ncbi:MAG: anti-sigma factor family protein [Terracidiphilus sp.]
MKHGTYDTGILRAFMDGELEAGQSAQVANHVENCSQCSAELSAMKNDAENVSSSLNELPETHCDAARTDTAWAKLRRKMRQEPEPQARVFTPWRIWSLAGAGTAVAFATLLFTVAPLRSWAENLLSIFRVEHFTVLEVNPGEMHGNLQNDAFFNQTIGHILSDDVKVTQAPQRPVAVSDAATASKLAGFQIRLLAGQTPSTLLFRSGAAAQMKLNRDRLQSILDEAGHGDLNIPESVDGAVVSLRLPAGIMAFYGNCGEMPARMQGAQTTGNNKQADTSCVSLMELPSPVVTAPPQIDPGQIAQIALQFLGMNANDAANFTQTVDWTTTLVLPVVQGQTSYEKVYVAGNDGVLLRPKTARADGTFTLMWVENGIVYALTGSGDDTTAVNLGEQLE